MTKERLLEVQERIKKLLHIAGPDADEKQVVRVLWYNHGILNAIAELSDSDDMRDDGTDE